MKPYTIGVWLCGELYKNVHDFICLERGKLSKVSLDDENEYDTKTIAGAVKLYFR